ncbi:hypothetical protein [Nocardia sp. CA-135398]
MVVRGTDVMRGYVGRPAETARVIVDGFRLLPRQGGFVDQERGIPAAR